MMVTARGKKCGIAAVLLGQLETENIAVESQRPVKIGHLQVNVADPDAGIKDRRLGCLFHLMVAFEWEQTRA